jgi:MFS family permease
MRQSAFYGWKLVAALWLIVFINLGFAAYGSPVMNAAMATQLHWSRNLAGLPYNLYTVMAGVPAMLVAVLVRRIGIRRTVMLGSALVFSGALAMATIVRDGLGAVLAFGVVVGLGVAWGGPFGVQPAVANWFVRRRALALAIVYAAGGVAGLVSGKFLLSPLIKAAGGDWRAGWWLYAGLAAVAFIIAAAFIRDRPEQLGQVPDGAMDALAPGASASPASARPAFISQEAWTGAEVARCGRFWVMVLALCGGSAGYTLFLSQGLLHLADLGYTADARPWALSITTGSTLLGKVALGTFGDRIDPRYIWAVTMVALGIGLLIIVDAHGPFALIAFSVLIGFGFGGGLVCMMSVLSNYFGAKAFPAAAGYAGALNTIVSFILSQSGGAIRDALGSYAPTFYSLAAWCFAGAFALMLVRPPVRHAVANPAHVAVSGRP